MSLFSKSQYKSGHSQLLTAVSGLSLLVVAGCASKGNDFYKHQPTFQPLEVPPNLTIPEANSGFEIPKVGSVEIKKVVLENGAQVKLRKDGRLRWLEISAPPEAVWNTVKDFWITKNVPLEWQNIKLGLMETGWIDHYDAEFEKDRFRVRIEPGEKAGTSELYLTHRGIQEAMVEGQVIYGWADKVSDPELDIEVLGELLSFMGLNADRKMALLDEAKKRTDSAVLHLKADVPNIVMQEPANRSWRFVMQAVDRMGYTVVERDKKARWIDVKIEKDETLDFTPLFSLTSNDRNIYRVQLLTKDKMTTITVLNDLGQPDRSEQAKMFLKDLKANL